jgi:hypothetical protein
MFLFLLSYSYRTYSIGILQTFPLQLYPGTFLHEGALDCIPEEPGTIFDRLEVSEAEVRGGQPRLSPRVKQLLENRVRTIE